MVVRAMPNKMRLLFLLAIAGWPAAAAHAGEAELFRRCVSLPAAAADAACTNYVYGVLTVLPSGPQVAAVRKDTCFPKVLAPWQAQAAVETYARDHPERLRGGAGVVRAEAFNAAYPCR
jgi:Ssp1 endopeptidase immunity protein Rap1a